MNNSIYKIIYFIWLLLLISFSVSSQSGWEAITGVGSIKDVSVHDEKAYVFNRNSLAIIDLITGEEDFYHNTNSGFKPEMEHALTSDGRLWFVSKGRLMTYDGNEFSEFKDPLLESLEVFQLVSRNDQLWITTFERNNSKLFLLLENRVYDKSGPIPSGSYYDLTVDQDGYIWMIINEQLVKYDENNTEIIATHPFVGIIGTYEYFVDAEGVHWVTHKFNRDATIFKYFDDNWETHFQPDLQVKLRELSGDIVYTFDNSLFTYTGDSFEISSLDSLYPEFLGKYDTLEIVAVKGDSVTWFSGLDRDKGYRLHRVANDKTDTYFEDLVFEDPRPMQLITDCEGIKYIIGDALRRYEDGQWSTIISDDVIIDGCHVTHLVLNPYTCDIWGYSINAIDCLSLFKLEDDGFMEFDILPFGQCHGLTFRANGDIYAASATTLIKIDSVGLVQRFNSAEHPTFSMNVFADSNDALWIIGIGELFDFGVFKVEDDIWEFYDLQNLSLIKAGHGTFEDNDNNLWIVNDAGLLMFDGSTWIEYPISDITFQNYITDLVQDKFGNYWISTSENGIAYWDKSISKYYNCSNSRIFSDQCTGLELESDSILWIQHNNGISKVNVNILATSTEDPKNPNTTPTQFSLYPNPTQSSFTLSFPHIEERKIEIFNTAGQLIYATETVDKSLTVSSLMSKVYDAGCYWVRVTGPSGRAVEKVVVY